VIVAVEVRGLVDLERAGARRRAAETLQLRRRHRHVRALPARRGGDVAERALVDGQGRHVDGGV
jgi:hypothetical protein